MDEVKPSNVDLMEFVGFGTGVDAMQKGPAGVAGRRDGRSFAEMRNLALEQGSLHNADGSACVHVGNTVVLAAVHGPTEALLSKQDAARCTVSVTVQDGSNEEVGGSNILRDLIRAVIPTALHPRKCVYVCVHILSADGGERAACINAAILALLDAGVPMLDVPVASCVSLNNGVVVADPSSTETQEADAVFTLTFSTKNGKLSNELASIHTTGDCGGQEMFNYAVSVGHKLAEHTLAFFKLSLERKQKQARAY